MFSLSKSLSEKPHHLKVLIHGRESMEHGSVFANVDEWIELPEKKNNIKKLLME